MNSWKTSFFGIIGAIGTAVITGYETTHMLDSLPPWVRGIAGLCMIIGPAGMGLAARDNNVTSEQAGIKPDAPSNPYSTRGPALLLIGCLAFGLMACARLQPGADPLVVRVEQTETTAKATFDLVLNVDNSNRPFWRTNSPPFHQFCEWLRTPAPVNGTTNALPRCSAMIWNVEDLKVAYKQGKASANSVTAALAVINDAVSQSQSWQSIVTNR